jgi:hypothetical protein
MTMSDTKSTMLPPGLTPYRPTASRPLEEEQITVQRRTRDELTAAVRRAQDEQTGRRT